jgi:protein-tyrosine phosphatase
MLKPTLIVCTGNICRSPMAEALLAARLKGVSAVSSAGIAASPGRPAEPEAIDICRANGLDIANHRARQLDEALLKEHPLVLVMEDAHGQWIARRFPHMRERVFLLGHYLESIEVPDPYGEDRAAFLKVFKQIQHCCGWWAGRLNAADGDGTEFS